LPVSSKSPGFKAGKRQAGISGNCSPAALKERRIPIAPALFQRNRLPDDAPEWQAAMPALILAAENDGLTMLARIGAMRALNRHVEQAT
jgi:hypothetical protein